MNEQKRLARALKIRVGDPYQSERLGACVIYKIERFAIVVEKNGRYYRISGVSNLPVTS